MSQTSEITRLLIDSRNGNEEAMNDVFRQVYDSLRSIAHRHLSQNNMGDTLNTTALVHEAYERLVGSASLDLHDRTHFFSVASRAMRFILVDYARAKTAGKRGGVGDPVSLNEMQLELKERSADLLNLDEALSRLMQFDEKLGRVVELRFFGGLTYEEIAGMEGRSLRTVKRDWERARAWLLYAMRSGI